MVSNTGDTVLPTYTVTDSFGACLQLVGASVTPATPGGAAPWASPVTWTTPALPALAVGGSVTITATLRVNAYATPV